MIRLQDLFLSRVSGEFLSPAVFFCIFFIFLSELGNARVCVCARFRIQERHAVFRNEQRRVTLAPTPGSKVVVNGNTVQEPTELQHLVTFPSLSNDPPVLNILNLNLSFPL